MKSDAALVAIKGTKHGLTITLLPGPVPHVLTELEERLTRTASFLKGAQVTLNVENSLLSGQELQEVDHLLRRHQIALRKIATEDSELASAGALMGVLVGPLNDVDIASHDADAAPGDSNAGIATASTTAGVSDVAMIAAGGEGASADKPASPALVVRRTLRSGMSLQHVGHVIVIGDVNPGAEVIAGGDIVVWGKLRGLVHAGAMGDNDALVCALVFDPTQLRIGNSIARMPDRKKRRSAPEMATIRKGKIEVIEWN